MSRRATLTTILTAMLLVVVPYAVMATDTDGDGTDDADDDFPNNPCADTDTDGDGMPDTVVSGCTHNMVVAHTSFEDPFTNGSKYYDYGNESIDHYLWNNIDQPHVSHNQTNGSEIGFTTYYASNGGVGLTDGDFFGTANYLLVVGNYTDGTQGYQMADVDGIATLSLDAVSADAVTFDLFVQDTSYEWSSQYGYDWINITFTGANSDVVALSTYGDDMDNNYSGLKGVWTSWSLNIASAGQGSLEVEFSSNAQTESIYLDNIEFTSTVVLTADNDDDDDGWLDTDEVGCGTDPLDSNDVPADADSNGICDALESDDFDGDGIPNDSDPDDDNDGVDDADDAFPLNPNEWDDTDGDGVGDNADEDDDGDGYLDSIENQCGTDPNDFFSTPPDLDGDGVCNALDDDDDDDGYLDSDDVFPEDPNEWSDTDNDGIGDNEETDDDDDGWSDAEESDCGTDSIDSGSVPADLDGDGTCDSLDEDTDGDGWSDADESDCGANPADDSSIPSDTDSDGECDVLDDDADNDGWSDADEADCQTDPYSSISIPDDFDGDHLCDDDDPDDDNDGTDDAYDMFPFDATEWADLDFDSIGNNADTDDDGDMWSDLDEPNCGTDPLDVNSYPNDNDADGICDSLDPDDDNDLVLDVDDAFPYDSCPLIDTDEDGMPNDITHCTSSTLTEDIDDDGDGVGDSWDAFPLDATEWDDTDDDGTGDNADADDDNDGWSDVDETSCGSSPTNVWSIPTDTDGDGICDEMDNDNTDGPDYVDPGEGGGTPGFGLISALAMLALAAFARRD